VLHIIDNAMLPDSNVEGVTSSSTSSIVKIDMLKVKINAQLVLSLICATGKSASEMLCSLKQRMKNDASTEVGTFSHVRIPDYDCSDKLLQSIDYLSKVGRSRLFVHLSAALPFLYSQA